MYIAMSCQKLQKMEVKHKVVDSYGLYLNIYIYHHDIFSYVPIQIPQKNPISVLKISHDYPYYP